MAINPQKFLPSAKSSSAIVKSSAPDTSSQKNKGGALIKAKKIDVNKLIPYKKEEVKGGALVNKEKTYEDISSKLVSIDSFLKSNLAGNKKASEAESIEKKEEKSKEKEEKIESKEKPKGVSGIGSISLPKFDFLESVKRYFLFTFLGWLFTNTKQYLPQLLKILDILKPVAKAAEFIFKSLLDGFIGFIDAGYNAYDKVKDVVKNIGGENAKKVFDDLSKNLNTLIATTIIVAGAIVALGEKQKPPGKEKSPGAQKPPRTRTGKPIPTTSGGRPLGRPDIRSPLRDRPRITGSGGGTAGSLDIRSPLRQKPRITTGGESKGLLRAVRPFLKRIPLPVVGALIDFGLSVALGESPGKAAFRAVGAGILGAIGAAIGGPFAIFTGIGGGYLGDQAGGALYDTFFGGKKPNQKGNNQPVQKKASGGKVFPKKSSSNKPKPKRTIKLAPKKPFRSPPQKSQPGKDVGGKKKIEILYPDQDPMKPMLTLDEWLARGDGGTYPDYVNRRKSGKEKQKIKPNPYKALTSTAEILKKIPLIGGIMGASVDLALGQKPDRRVYQSLSSGLGYLVDSLANDKANLSAVSLQRDLGGFADGGYVPPSRELIKSKDTLSSSNLISKIIGPNIEQKVTEALQNLQKELQKKPQKDKPEAGPPGTPSADGGGSYSEGGIATGLGVNKGVSVAKKLIADLGITPAQAAGIVGNFLYESAGMNPAEVQGAPFGIPEKPPTLGTTGVGYGWAQWTNSRPGDRLDKFLKSYGGDKGKIATDDDNYRYLMTELRGSESLQGMPKDDPQAASDWFRVNWERAGIPADEKRRKETLAVFDKIKGLSREQAKIDVQASGAKFIEAAPAEAGTVDSSNPTLAKLATTNKLVALGSGKCTASVAKTLDANGVFLEPGGTTGDSNNPRGLISKLVNKSGWASLPGLGSSTVLNSPLGATRANVMTYAQYSAAVDAGKIPSGALVFQTKHGSWNQETGSSSGFDAAIARNGGKELWNGNNQQNGRSIYGSSTKEVVVLVPSSSRKPSAAPVQPTQTPRQPPKLNLTEVQSKIGAMKLGDPPLNYPGIGRIVMEKNDRGTGIKKYYDSNNNLIDSGKFFELLKNPRQPKPGQPPVRPTQTPRKAPPVKAPAQPWWQGIFGKNNSGSSKPRSGVIPPPRKFLGFDGQMYTVNFSTNQIKDEKGNLIEVSNKKYPRIREDLRNAIQGDLKLQGGGPLGSPNQRNYSSLSSYPSYDSGGGMMIAIQPIIIEKQIPIPTRGGGGMPLMFPSGNLNSKDTYASHSLSRG